MTITVSTTDRRDGKALALFARWQDWQRCKTKDGRSFFAIPGSEPGPLHIADQNDCSCPDRQRSRNVCEHMRAVRLWMAACVTGAVAPKPRPATPAVIDDAGVGDELVVLTPGGAAYLAGEEQAQATHPSYGDIFRPCRGCGDLADGRDGLCGRCVFDREWQAKATARREMIPAG